MNLYCIFKAWRIGLIFALFQMLLVGTVYASDADYLRPTASARWTFDENKCQTPFKRMEKLLDLWAAGKALALDDPNRPDQEIWGGRLPFWAYKGQDIAMRETFGDLYFNGCDKAGKAPEKIAAFEMYQLSAINNSPSAQFKLGRMLREGDGVQKNEEAGLAWISSAAIEGSPDAAKYLETIGIEAPEPIWPNSYAVAAMESKEIFDGLRKAERAEVVRDLANLAVGVAAVYLNAQALTPSQSNQNIVRPTQTTAAQPATFRPFSAQKPLLMTRPIYCRYDADVMMRSGGNSAFVFVKQFCN